MGVVDMVVLSKEDRIAARSKQYKAALKLLPTLTPPVPGFTFDQESGGFKKEDHDTVVLAKLSILEAKMDAILEIITSK